MDELETDVTTRVGIIEGKVVVVWDKPIAAFYLDPDDADKFADTIKEKAEKIRELTN